MNVVSCTRHYTCTPAIELAKRLGKIAPGDLQRVLFAPGGTSAIGIAVKLELRQKAATPDVQLALAPFITPGYSQVQGVGIELKPLSYSALDGAGALAPDIRGLTHLLTIAWTSKDKVRPRWKLNPTLFSRHPDQIEKVKQAQDLLIELGPVLVEMGQLQP